MLLQQFCCQRYCWHFKKIYFANKIVAIIFVGIYGRELFFLSRSNPRSDYAQLFAEVKERVLSAQFATLKAVNTGLVGLYRDIGRMIVERQKKAGERWGKAVVQQLAGVIPKPGQRLPEENQRSLALVR